MTSERRVTIPVDLYKGDTHEPLSFLIADNEGKGRSLSGKTIEILMHAVTDDTGAEPQYNATPKIAQTASNVEAEPQRTITVDTADDWILCDNHGYENGWEVSFSGSTAVPTGLSATTTYFVIDAYKNRFKVAAYEDGTAVNITGAGTSPKVHAIGHVEYSWQSADVNTAGKFGVWAVIIDGSLQERVPPDNWGIRVNINEISTA